MNSLEKDSYNVAGLAVIHSALDDISECLDGSYREGSRRFYYAPFLLTSDVTLDKDFNPDLERHSITLESLQPSQRIIDHAVATSLECVSKVTNRKNYASQSRAAFKCKKARKRQANFSKRIAILRQSLSFMKKRSTRCRSR